LNRAYEYYDPIDTLPPAGQAWWAEHASDPAHLDAAVAAAAASRAASLAQHEAEVALTTQ